MSEVKAWKDCPTCGQLQKLIDQYQDSTHPELVIAVKNFREDLLKPCKVCTAHHAAVTAAVAVEEKLHLDTLKLIESYHICNCEHSDNPCECAWCNLKKDAGL